MAVEVAEDASHRVRQNLEVTSRAIGGGLADKHRGIEQAASRAALHENEPVALLPEHRRVPNMGVQREVLADLLVGELRREPRQDDIEVTDEVERRRCVAFRPRLEPGVEDEEVSRLEAAEPALRRRWVPLGEGLELGVDVHGLCFSLELEPCWEVVDEAALMPAPGVAVGPLINAGSIGNRDELELVVGEERAADPPSPGVDAHAEENDLHVSGLRREGDAESRRASR